MTKPQATLQTVAKESGVSVSTVSRVLNNRTQNFSVREETRRRILAAAEAQDYRPDPIVRSIRAKQTNLVAVLGLRDFGTTIRGATEEAINTLMENLYDAGYELCTNIFSPREPAYAPPRWRVDGVVTIDCSDVSQLDRLERSGVPYVTLNGPSGPGGSSVQVDDDQGTRLAVHHLLALGHRRIAYVIPDEFAHHESLELRHRAYADELTKCGHTPMTPVMLEPAPAMEVVQREVLQGGATALIVYHHVMAVKLLRTASTLGLRVPQDVSIVCFNDAFPCWDLKPSLTVMRLPWAEMGRTAAGMLLEGMRASGSGDAVPTRHERLDEQLVIRESTAPPPGGPALA